MEHILWRRHLTASFLELNMARDPEWAMHFVWPSIQVFSRSDWKKQLLLIRFQLCGHIIASSEHVLLLKITGFLAKINTVIEREKWRKCKKMKEFHLHCKRFSYISDWENICYFHVQFKWFNWHNSGKLKIKNRA